jgi:hypothetical protein
MKIKAPSGETARATARVLTADALQLPARSTSYRCFIEKIGIEQRSLEKTSQGRDTTPAIFTSVAAKICLHITRQQCVVQSPPLLRCGGNQSTIIAVAMHNNSA